MATRKPLVLISGELAELPEADSILSYLESIVAGGAALAAGASGVVKNLTSIVLTPGDWDISGYMSCINGAATMSDVVVGSSSTSATLGTEPSYFEWAPAIPASQCFSFHIPIFRYVVAVNTTIYLVTRLTYTGTTPTIFGALRARKC